MFERLKRFFGIAKSEKTGLEVKHGHVPYRAPGGASSPSSQSLHRRPPPPAPPPRAYISRPVSTSAPVDNSSDVTNLLLMQSLIHGNTNPSEPRPTPVETCSSSSSYDSSSYDSCSSSDSSSSCSSD